MIRSPHILGIRALGSDKIALDRPSLGGSLLALVLLLCSVLLACDAVRDGHSAARRCGVRNPCPSGYACVEGKCVATCASDPMWAAVWR